MLSHHLSFTKILLFICLYDVCISIPHHVRQRKCAEYVNNAVSELHKKIWGDDNDLRLLMYCNNTYNISLNNTAICQVRI